MEKQGSWQGDLMALWAKTGKGDHGYHPLLCHLLDVAAVANELWESVMSPWARASVARDLEVDETTAQCWIAFWAGTHDLGKCSPAFQTQSVPSQQRLQAACFPWVKVGGKAPHGTVSARALEQLLPAELRFSQAMARTIAALVGGHHGIIPRAAEVQKLPLDAVGKLPWETARRRLLRELGSILGVDDIHKPRRLPNSTAMWIAGLISVADWVGSDERFFRYACADVHASFGGDARNYWAETRNQAHKALKDLDWLALPPLDGGPSFGDMFGFPPNPMQQLVVDVSPDVPGPALMVIEVPMGEGKTEAAMWLADQWGGALGQYGSYFALPTQATSNQMFGRVCAFLQRRYPEAAINVQLVHGHASISSALQELRDGEGQLDPGDVDRDQPDQCRPPDVIAAEWFTYRKRGLLAPFGVGTIDQALLAALQTKHVFVRLFGLSHKTVIVDEVHAYDTYMTDLLQRLLEWLASLRTSVILLSATLPRNRLESLLHAYASGLGSSQPETNPASYPRISWVDAKGSADSRAVELSAAAGKSIQIAWFEASGDETVRYRALGMWLREKLVAGGCAAVVCNTVGRAQGIFTALQDLFPGTADDGLPVLDLFHARYPFEQRQEREDRVLRRFSKPGDDAERPDRAVLIATQVIEQSLDLDFDLMVTDLAPIDLLLQRSGRLQRHDRPIRRVDSGRPTLTIIPPERIEDCVPQFDRGSAAVYDAHILLRSWIGVQGRTTVSIPHDIEQLVEGVYGDGEPPADASVALRRRWETTKDTANRHEQTDIVEALKRKIKSPDYDESLAGIASDPRAEDEPELHRAVQAVTRLGEPSVGVVCLHGAEERPTLRRGDGSAVNLSAKPTLEMCRELLMRSASLSGYDVVTELLRREVPSGWRESALMRQYRPLIFDETDTAHVGECIVGLDSNLGLVVSRPMAAGREGRRNDSDL